MDNYSPLIENKTWQDVLDEFYVEYDEQIYKGEFKGKFLLMFRKWLEKTYKVPEQIENKIMEKSNFLEMVEELAETIKKDIINNSKEFVNSGCINFDIYNIKGNYTLPKMFITAYLNNHKDEYNVCFERGFTKKDYENMKHFI